MLLENLILKKTLSLTFKLDFRLRISDYGDNVSDHLPVELDLSVSLQTITLPSKRKVSAVAWHRLDTNCLETFRRVMTEKLDEISVPFHSAIHGDHCCTNLDHVNAIQSYYESIVTAIHFADRILPRTANSLNKPFWSNALDELKQRSVQCCRECSRRAP